MRKITFWLSLVLIFIIPWEDSVSINSIGSLSRLIGFIVAGFWFITIIIEGRFRKPHLFHALVLIFILWNMTSYMWSMDIARTVQRISTYGQIFILMIIIWEFYLKPSDLIAGLQAYVLGSFVLIGSLISNYLNGIKIDQWEVRYSATGVNAVDLSLLLLLGIPIAWKLFHLAEIKKYRILKIINISYLPLAIFSIFLTGSRTSLFAIIPSIIYIIWPKRLAIGRSILIMILLVISLMVIQALLPSEISGRLATASSSIGSADIGGRVYLWNQAINIFLNNPLIGSGSGALSTIIGTEAHQAFLSILAETGLIGFLLFTSIIAIVVNQAAMLPDGYSGLWFAVFLVWTIGALSLSWEFRKPTWLFLNFVIIQGNFIHEQIQSSKNESEFSKAKTQLSLENKKGSAI